MNQQDVISLPITVRDYDNDGMLFEYASQNYSSTGKVTQNYSHSDDYITAPKPACGYNMAAMQKLGAARA